MATKKVIAADLKVGDVVVHKNRKFEIIWKSIVQAKDGCYAFDARSDTGQCSRSLTPPGFTMDVLK